MMNNILTINNLSHYYKDGSEKRIILNNLSIDFKEGIFYSILGESGCGKTTFLSLIAGLEKIQNGEIIFNGDNITSIGYDNYRKNNISIIFQDYNLINNMSVYENISSALEIKRHKITKNETMTLLKRLGLNENIIDKKVNKLSGGEKQRIAIARAIAADSMLILADEPTGNLDKKNGKEIIAIFKDLAHISGKTIIMVTHNEILAKESDEILYLDQNQGKLVSYEKYI